MSTKDFLFFQTNNRHPLDQTYNQSSHDASRLHNHDRPRTQTNDPLAASDRVETKPLDFIDKWRTHFVSLCNPTIYRDANLQVTAALKGLRLKCEFMRSVEEVQFCSRRA